MFYYMLVCDLSGYYLLHVTIYVFSCVHMLEVKNMNIYSCNFGAFIMKSFEDEV